jgi:hypothetical protein
MTYVPTRTGVYPLMLPDGRVVRRKVKRMNGDLMMVEPGGFLWLFAALVPLDLVEGIWIE